MGRLHLLETNSLSTQDQDHPAASFSELVALVAPGQVPLEAPYSKYTAPHLILAALD